MPPLLGRRADQPLGGLTTLSHDTSMNSAALALVSIAVGGIVTWWVTRYYYVHASEDLRTQANELRRLNNLMLHGMQHAGWIQLNRDESGRILGFEQIIYPKGIESDEAFGIAEVRQSPPTQ